MDTIPSPRLPPIWVFSLVLLFALLQFRGNGHSPGFRWDRASSARPSCFRRQTGNLREPSVTRAVKFSPHQVHAIYLKQTFMHMVLDGHNLSHWQDFKVQQFFLPEALDRKGKKDFFHSTLWYVPLGFMRALGS